MGVTRTELFTDKQNSLAALAKALAHPARVAILEKLATAGKCVNATFVAELGLAQPTISQHLRELRDAGLIKGSIDGVSINYCIDTEKWAAVKRDFNALFDAFTPPESPLCC